MQVEKNKLVKVRGNYEVSLGLGSVSLSKDTVGLVQKYLWDNTYIISFLISTGIEINLPLKRTQFIVLF